MSVEPSNDYINALDNLKWSINKIGLDASKLDLPVFKQSAKTELSIDSVYQILLEDRERIKTQVIDTEIRIQFLAQNTDVIADLLQLKMHYEQQTEEQACESIQAELDNGEELAKLLAKHLIAMGSCGTSFDVEVYGNQFYVEIRSGDNVMDEQVE